MCRARAAGPVDATLSALLRRADTKKGVYDLSPKRSAVLDQRAFEVQTRREALIEGVPASKGLHTFEEHRCRSSRVDSLQALLDDLDDLVRADAARARRATRGRAGIVAAAALGGLAAYVVLPLAL